MASSARSPSEKKSGGKAAPPHFLFLLAAALDNPTVKSLEWHEDGKGVLLHAKLYDEEIQRHPDLFPELKNLKPVSVLQAWLAAYGFKERSSKTDSEVLIFQHVDFKKLPPKAEETESLKSDSLVIPKQTKKTKKRKNTLDVPVASTAGTSGTLLTECAGVERKPQRLRPLYQYINYDNPQMNCPTNKECDLAQMDVPPTLDYKASPLEQRVMPPKVAGDKSRVLGSPQSPTPGVAFKVEVDKSTQVDIDKMLSVCAAHLVPPLSPQPK